MQYNWLILDGYNLLHQKDDLAELLNTNIQSARHRLVRFIEKTAHELAHQTTIVFDGREMGSDIALTSKYLEVFFSPSNLSADTIIERLVCKYERPEKIMVVTSDRAERDTVSSAGAQTMSSQEFLSQCKQVNGRSVIPQTPPGKNPKLGDLFPDGL